MPRSASQSASLGFVARASAAGRAGGGRSRSRRRCRRTSKIVSSSSMMTPPPQVVQRKCSSPTSRTAGTLSSAGRNAANCGGGPAPAPATAASRRRTHQAADDAPAHQATQVRLDPVLASSHGHCSFSFRSQSQHPTHGGHRASCHILRTTRPVRFRACVTTRRHCHRRDRRAKGSGDGTTAPASVRRGRRRASPWRSCVERPIGSGRRCTRRASGASPLRLSGARWCSPVHGSGHRLATSAGELPS